jgi:antitoxin (DNA-binding transcriptional repressor) of toxin-antitoxin stability system
MKNYPIYPVAEFEERFDEMFERVENGETIGILNTDGNVVVMTPIERSIVELIENENK